MLRDASRFPFCSLKIAKASAGSLGCCQSNRRLSAFERAENSEMLTLADVKKMIEEARDEGDARRRLLRAERAGGRESSAALPH
jgi:hypothetical protein